MRRELGLEPGNAIMEFGLIVVVMVGRDELGFEVLDTLIQSALGLEARFEKAELA